MQTFAESTMNELLGWYGYDKVDLRDSEANEIRNYRERRQHVSVLKGEGQVPTVHRSSRVFLNLHQQVLQVSVQTLSHCSNVLDTLSCSCNFSRFIHSDTSIVFSTGLYQKSTWGIVTGAKVITVSCEACRGFMLLCCMKTLSHSLYVVFMAFRKLIAKTQEPGHQSQSLGPHHEERRERVLQCPLLFTLLFLNKFIPDHPQRAQECPCHCPPYKAISR